MLLTDLLHGNTHAAPVAPETALPAHLTVCKATAPDGAVNPSAATPAACFPLWTFRGLE
ncbi:hypothetical protein [Salmonella enterica]|uniref:hypothetical protein n=1 Tax=Salmonella enterica TaxID=28901 RepID=UPI00237F4C00|nr:hypothetical protein [Salmonella enterica]